MAFTIERVAAPTPPAEGQSATQVSARDRAIAKLLPQAAPQAQAEAVQNPSQVSPEELSAVKAPEEEGQEITSEEQVVETAPETPVEETPAPKEESPLSAQYAQLARKEKAIRAQAMELKQREAAIKAREASLAPQQQQQPSQAFDQSKYISRDAFAKDPMAALGEVGLSYEKLTEMALNAPSPEQQQLQSTIQKLEAKLAAIEEGQKATQENMTKQQQAQYEQAINQLHNETVRLVESNPEFETIKAMGASKEVVELITKTFETDGTLLTVEEAAKAVEEYLEEEAFKYARLTKIQKRLSPQAAAQKPVATSAAAAPQKPQGAGQSPGQPMKTLTNAVGAQRQLSARERAIAAFQGAKK